MSPSDRTVITLSAPVSEKVRRMGATMGDLGPTEIVRRGIILLDLLLSLPDSEELVIRNKVTEQIERIRFAWDSFDQRETER